MIKSLWQTTKTHNLLRVKVTIMNNNQNEQLLSLLADNPELAMGLNEKDAETISGGAQEVFTMRNKTKYNITYTLDGKNWLHRPGEEWIWTTYQGGKVTFDIDGRKEYKEFKSYNLSNGKIYEFQDNNYTKGNPYDIDLYYVYK